MRLAATPPLSDPVLAALHDALARAGVRVDSRPEAYASAWRRATARESVRNEPVPATYARSPRSTRGATRA